jgi:hypothetical protein
MSKVFKLMGVVAAAAGGGGYAHATTVFDFSYQFVDGGADVQKLTGSFSGTGPITGITGSPIST